MATTTAPAAVETLAEPVAAEPKGPLASILNGVQPARPVEPIGSTAAMAEEPSSTSGEKPARTSGRNGAQQEGHWAALVRALATRIGRGGNASTVKRVHTITESRMTGNQVNTAQRINRDTKHSGLNHRDAKLNDNNSKIRQHSGRDHRDVKASDAKASTHNGQSRTGRDVKNHRDAKTSGATTSKQDVMHTTGRDGLDGKPGKATDGKPTKPTTGKDAAPKTTEPTDAPKKPDTTKASGEEKPKTAPEDKKTTDQKPANVDDTPAVPRPRTQPSREAGYADGTVAAKVAGHVKAYRDGAKDGYADGTVEYEQEKRRMDDAKARNAIKPTGPAKPDMQPVTGSTVDLAKNEAPTDRIPVAPVQLTGLSETHIAFDADGASSSLSRAEVRTLKGFERRIAAKQPVLQKVAEGSKVARVRATEHATRAQQLAEAAKTVQGGDRLVAKLQRLAEQAQALRARTEEVEKHAHRGAEAVTVLVANAGTRHGGIYKAVVDSPLTSPAEREFYQDKEGN
jgi:hypothetical protein